MLKKSKLDTCEIEENIAGVVTSHKVKGISMEKYDELPEEEQIKYQVPFLQEELDRLIAGSLEAEQKEKELFISVMDLPEVEWVVEGFIVREGITLLFGDAGIGKTSLMLQLIGCVTEVKPFLDQSVIKSNVLLVEQDEGPSVLRSHIQKMVFAHPSLWWLKLPKNTIYWNNASRNFEADGMILKELIAYSSADIVIIDSLTSLGIEDINHPSSSIVFDRLRDMANKLRCSFVVLHHPNKSGGIMGNNLIEAKVDCLVQMKKEDGVIKFVPRKIRGEGFETKNIYQNPDTLVFNSAPEKKDWIRELHELGKKPKEIAEIVSVAYPQSNANTVSAVIHRLKNPNK